MKYHWEEFHYRVWKFFNDFPGKSWVFHRFHPRHRYNIVHTGLKPGYYDPDTRIAFAITHEFCRFVDRQTKDRIGDEEDNYYASLLDKKFPRMLEIREWLRTNDIDDPDGYDRSTEILCEIIRLRNLLWY